MAGSLRAGAGPCPSLRPCNTWRSSWQQKGFAECWLIGFLWFFFHLFVLKEGWRVRRTQEEGIFRVTMLVHCLSTGVKVFDAGMKRPEVQSHKPGALCPLQA